MNNHTNNNELARTNLRIWQQNLHTAQAAHEHMLRNLHPEHYDIAIIQEPYLNPVNLALCSSRWDIIYPTTHGDTGAERTNSIILVNKKISKNTWKIIPFKNSNVTAIELRGNFGRISIFNVYNSWRHIRTLEALEKHIDDANEANNPLDSMIWMGDFNCHDPMWDDTTNNHLFTGPNLQRSATLINLLAKYSMRMALAGGIATLEASNTKNRTRPDNVFCSTDLLNTFIYCDVEEELRLVSADHFPIISILDLTPEQSAPKPRRNYRATDWEEFQEELEQQLNIIPPPNEILTVEQFHTRLHLLQTAILTAIEKKVPMSKPSPHAKRWWSPELNSANRALKKLARKAKKKHQIPDHPIHEEHRRARNDLPEMQKKTKEEHWKEYLESVDEGNIWDVHDFLTNSPTDRMRSRIPTLQERPNARPAEDNAEKSELLYKTFF